LQPENLVYSKLPKKQVIWSGNRSREQSDKALYEKGIRSRNENIIAV
jgi:hypothetical protein